MKHKMKTKTFSIDKDGFYGYLHQNKDRDICMILYVDDDPNSLIGKGPTKWFVEQGVNVLAMSPAPKNTGLLNVPMDHIENAVKYLKQQGYQKVGIMGLSSTAMISLVAASLIPDITLTIAATPSDFVMGGTIQDKLDGVGERPAEGQSSLSWRGEPIPFLPYAFHHPDYWNTVKEEGKRRGDMLAALELFNESERCHPLAEYEFIKVENIQGHLVLAGARDDVMWPTTKYIQRMVDRLESHDHQCTYETMIFDHGTHYVFPEGAVKKLLPLPDKAIDFVLTRMFSEAKGYTDECRATRRAIEKRVLELVKE